MPDFVCLGKRFQLSQADLDRAPGSVLAEAWGASSGSSAVSLDRWPRPDVNVLKAVISILEQKPCDPGKAARAVVEALDYFAVQDSIWPAGLLVLKRQIYSNKLWLDRDCEAAIDIVQQITKLVLEIAAEAYPRPTEKSTGKEPVGVFYIKSRDERNSEYLIEQCSGDEGHSGSLPTTLAEAIVQAGKHDHLEVQFRVHRFQDRDGVSRIVHRIAVHTCHA